ncbi:hypothetical protein GCM10027456_17440 [Kineosporia babensis]
MLVERCLVQRIGGIPGSPVGGRLQGLTLQMQRRDIDRHQNQQNRQDNESGYKKQDLAAFSFEVRGSPAFRWLLLPRRVFASGEPLALRRSPASTWLPALGKLLIPRSLPIIRRRLVHR